MAISFLGASLPMPTSKVIYVGDCPGATFTERFQHAMDNTGDAADDYNTIQLEHDAQYIEDTIVLARTPKAGGYPNQGPGNVTTLRSPNQLLKGVTIRGGTDTYINWNNSSGSAGYDTGNPFPDPANKCMFELPAVNMLTLENFRFRNKYGVWDGSNKGSRATQGIGLWIRGGYGYDVNTATGMRLINIGATHNEKCGIYIGDPAGPDITSLLIDQSYIKYSHTGIIVEGTNITGFQINMFRMGDPLTKRPFYLRGAPNYQFATGQYQDPWGNAILVTWTDAFFPFGYHGSQDNTKGGSYSWNFALRDANSRTRLDDAFVDADAQNVGGPPYVHILDSNVSPQIETEPTVPQDEKLYAIVAEHCPVYVDKLRIERQCGLLLQTSQPGPANNLISNRMGSRPISEIKNATMSGIMHNPVVIEENGNPPYYAGYPTVFTNCNFQNSATDPDHQPVGTLTLPRAEWSEYKRIQYIGTNKLLDVETPQDIMPYDLTADTAADTAFILDFPPHVLVVSSALTDWVRLPVATAGKRLRMSIAANGCSVKTFLTSSDTINDQICSGATNTGFSMALPADAFAEFVCTTDGAWIATVFDKTGNQTNPTPA